VVDFAWMFNFFCFSRTSGKGWVGGIWKRVSLFGYRRQGDGHLGMGW